MSHYNIIANAPCTDFADLLHDAWLQNVILLDGAANHFQGYLTPLCIIGDMDSITEASKSYFRSRGVRIMEIMDQNTTDLEKAITLCMEDKNLKTINIYNASGGRLDHSILNLRLLKKYYSDKYEIRLFTSSEKVIFLRDCYVTLQGNKHDKVALLAFTCAAVTSHGLLYEMDGYRLEFAMSEGTSNSLNMEYATIRIKGDVLLIMDKSINLLNLDVL